MLNLNKKLIFSFQIFYELEYLIKKKKKRKINIKKYHFENYKFKFTKSKINIFIKIFTIRKKNKEIINVYFI